MVAFLARISRTKSKHYANLVEADYKCNLLHNQISDEIYLANDFLSMAEKQSIDNVKIWARRFSSINCIFDSRPDISNIHLINEIFRFDVSVRKINNDSSVFNNTLDDLQSMFMEKKFPAENYITNIKNLAKKVELLSNYVDDMRKDLKRVGNPPIFNGVYQ